MTDHTGVMVDSKAPRLVSAALDRTLYKSGFVMALTLTFNETLQSGGATPAPYVEAMIGGSARQLSLVRVNGNVVLLEWTVPANVEDYDGIAFSDRIHGPNFYLSDAIGNRSGTVFTDSIRFTAAEATVDSRPPSVTAIEEPADGFYRVGDRLAYKATFSEPVTVTGRPYVRVGVGSSNYKFNYESGTGTNELVFALVLPAGINDPDGIDVTYIDQTITTDNIFDLSGNRYPLNLRIDLSPLVPATNNIIIDNTAPVTGALISTSGDYKLGDEISFSIPFDEPMVMQGSRLAMQILVGTTSGTTVTRNLPLTLSADKMSLEATYTVVAGDLDLDGIQIAGHVVSEDGASHLTDRAGNFYSQFFGTPAYNIRVDATTPEVNQFQFKATHHWPGDVMTMQVSFTKAVNISGTPELDILVNGVYIR